MEGPLHIVLQAKIFDDGYSESLTVGERKEIPLKYFAWPDAPGGKPKYPADTQDHLDSLATLIGRAPDTEQPKIKARAIRIAKELGLKLPDSWKEETNESGKLVGFGRTLLGLDESARPAKKIGTLKLRWLKYNDFSENQRVYPQETCDAIFHAAQEVLSNPNAMPPTTFVSHEAANGNMNVELVGAPVKVWQEGNEFWTLIDLADTSVARDMLALAEGGYLKSGSMRVAGVELRHDPKYHVPIVIVQEGVTPRFLGIDLTTRPGLADTARITQVLYESADQQSICIDSFKYDSISVESKEGSPPAMPLPLFIQVALGVLTEAKSSREAHTAIHDHLAGVMDECMGPKHGSESTRYRALIEGQLDEAGKAIAMKHAARLAAAHDESARQLGMKCEGCYKEAFAPSDTDQDGDNPAAGDDPDKDGESQKGTDILNEQEMIEALKAKGFAIEAPKTDAQKLEEQAAKLAELEAKLLQLAESAPTQRQTLANQSQFEESSTLQEEQMYEDGDYLKSDLAPKNWRALSNRRVPWPKDLDPKLALHEMAPFLAHSLNAQEAAARGRDISAFIQPNELM